MQYQNKTRHFIAILLTAGLSLMSIVPFAQAANPIISNFISTAGTFYFNIKDNTPVYTIDYDFNTGGPSTAPVTEQIRDENGNVTYEFGAIGTDNKATGHYTLQWDGKYKNGGNKDGTYVPDGKYRVYINSQTASPPAANYTSALFDAKSASAPVVELTSQPISHFYLVNGGDFTVNYHLTQGAGSSTTIVRLKIKSATVQEVVVDSAINTTDGDSTVSWDGKWNNIAVAADDYTWTITPYGSVNGYTYEGDSLTGTVKVASQAAPSPTFTSVTATPTTFDVDKEGVTFTYTLNGSLGNTTVNGDVFLTSAPSTVLKHWAYTNQASGQNTIVWDGKNTNNIKLAEGDYIFKVSGTDGNFQIVPAQVGFTVQKTTLPPSTNCAGFTDVKTGDPDCKAIEFAQSMGAMTGNPDGTFAPDDLLQRDQIAKIVLETFQKFNKQNDYCLGVSAFPDVTESEWSYQYICRGKALNIITGYQSGTDMGFYRPSRNVNRAEFLALLLRNLSDTMPSVDSISYNDVISGAWFAGYAKYAHDNSLFGGNTLYPTNFTTRLEVAQVIYKLHQLGKV